MKKNLYFLFLVILPVSLFSQLVENAPQYFNYFTDTPYYEIEPDGVGSFGFGNPLSNFNPIYQTRPNKLMFSIAANCNIHTSTFYKDYYSSRHFDFYDEVVIIKPDFILDYQIENLTIPEHKLGTYQFRISHYADMNQKNTANISYNLGGHHFSKLITSKSNYVLQFTVIRKISESISLSGSYLTNQFLYSIEFPGYGKQSIRSDYFAQKQLHFSLNINLPRTNIYLLAKTQEAAVTLSPGRLSKIENLISGNDKIGRPVPQVRPVYNNAVLSYPGIFALGIQYSLNHKINISLESVNHYLRAEEKLAFQYPFYYDDVEAKFKHDVINPELVAGMSYQTTSKLNLGTSISYYLSYDYSGDHDDVITESHAPYEIQNPLSAVLSSSYELGKFSLGMHYQYSYARIQYGEYHEYNSGDETQQIHQLKFSLNYGML